MESVAQVRRIIVQILLKFLYLFLISEAERIGVYIPFKDADWEIPENEEFYQHTNMNEQYTTCDAKNCACNKGRKYSLPGTR